MNTEQRIRELAHQIWESEGQPDGEAARHWQMAIKLLDNEQQEELQPLPVKQTTSRKPRKKVASAPDNNETQLEKPALLGKPAGAKKTAKAKRQPIVRTTKISEPATSPNDSSRDKPA